jgi:hypothetical protein
LVNQDEAVDLIAEVASGLDDPDGIKPRLKVEPRALAG